MILGIVLIVALVGGLISYAVANSRGLPGAGGYGVLGAFFPLIGIIVAAVAKPGAPAGMQAVRCQTCNADQNIAAGAQEWICWQCQTEWTWPART